MTTSSLIMRGAAIAVAAVALGGTAFWAHNSFAAQNPFAAPMTGMADSAEHIARISEHINAEAGTTPQQKAQIDALLEQARRDFEPVHARMKEDHELAVALLTADRVDRAELETLRQSHLRLADQASVRMTRLIADVADVLTPAQRKVLAAKVKQHHAGHMGRHHGG